MNCAASGASTFDIRPYADHVLATFGADRVLWASDWPPLDLVSDYATWKRVSDEVLSAYSDGDRQAVQHATATRVYRLANQGKV